MGKIVERVTRKNQDLVSELPLTISAQYGLIDQNEFFDKRVASKDVSGYYLIYNGEFAYNKSTSSDAPWGAIKRLDRYENGVLSTLYIVFRIKNEDILNSDFLMNYYDTNNWHKDIQAIASEGARNHGLLNIAPADFFETELMLPQDIEEQKNIGNYFKSLNNLITLHQRKSFLYFSRINDWEQRKLNEYLQVSKVKNKDAAFSKEDVLSVSGDYGIVNQIEFQGRSFAGVSVAAYGVVETGDVVYTKSPLKSNPYGIIKTNKGKTGIVSTLYAVYKPLNNVHSEFVQIYFEQDARMNNYMHSLVNKGAKNDMKVSDENALKGEVFFPSKDEQIKISKYFGKIDHLIALHQRKCDETKKLKKFMLQKMFPKKDAKKPEIRFAGFTNDWEQRKFGDVGSVAMCKRIFKEQTSDEGEVPFYKIGTFGGEPDAFISRKLFDEYKTKYPYPHKGDILISASGSIGRTIEFTGKDEYFQDSNIVWLKHENEIDNNFLKVLYSIVEWSCEGSTIKRLYNDNFLKTEFMLPQIDEQIKLGDYFANLDNLITLHQRKCDELKEFKKYMLQNMFPQKG